MQWGRRKKSSSERNRKRRRNQQMAVLSRLIGSFVAGNIYQICRKHILDLHGQQCNKCGKSNHFAAKCTGGKQFSCNLHVNRNMNYVQEDSDESQFEEYTIITYQVSVFEQKKV